MESDALLILAIVAISGFTVFADFIVQKIRSERERNESSLRRAFYSRLQTKGSNITTIGLAVDTNIEAAIVKRYLERQAKVLGGVLDFDNDGEIFYRFPKINPQLPPSD